MQFKFIDTKIKEIYYTNKPIQEDSEIVEARYNFWKSMNMIGIQNISMQNIKTA